MKILFVSDVGMANPASGSETVLNRQAKGLEGCGFSVGAITRLNGYNPKDKIRSIQQRSINEICYCADPTETFRFIIATLTGPPALFSKYFNNPPPAAAICHQPFTCFSLLRSGKLRKIPYVYVFHSPNHEEFKIAEPKSNNPLFRPQILMRKALERYCLKNASLVMVLSAFMRQKVIDIHQIPPQQIVINPGGADLSRFYPFTNRHQIKSELSLPDKKVHLLTVRNLEPRMGLKNLLYAVKQLKEKQIPIHLTICGDGILKQELENLSCKLQLNTSVRMEGFVCGNLLPKYYSAADFFVLPTEHLEGFGLVTVESMAGGTPVLGTPVGGTNEILSKFEPRLIFKNSTPEAISDGITAAIETYYNDNSKYEKLRHRCREHAENSYSWQRHVNQLRLLINDIASKDK